MGYNMHAMCLQVDKLLSKQTWVVLLDCSLQGAGVL
jgi:hypothetical protein